MISAQKRGAIESHLQIAAEVVAALREQGADALLKKVLCETA